MTLNAVLCGCGAMSKGWLRTSQETPALAGAIAVKGLVDLNPAVAEALAAEFGLSDAVIGADLGDVIARTEADIVFDVVIPATRERTSAFRNRSTINIKTKEGMSSKRAVIEAI